MVFCIPSGSLGIIFRTEICKRKHISIEISPAQPSWIWAHQLNKIDVHYCQNKMFGSFELIPFEMSHGSCDTSLEYPKNIILTLIKIDLFMFGHSLMEIWYLLHISIWFYRRNIREWGKAKFVTLHIDLATLMLLNYTKAR